jgi:arsenate reductase
MKKILFVCTHNAGRSQMAEALFNRHAPADVRAESAGHEPRREGVWPEVVEAMREIGIDLAAQRPKRLLVEMQLHADWAVTLACDATCPYVPTIVEDWDVPDPAGKSLEEVRQIRDQIEVRVHDLIDHRLEAIRADRTVHQLRLVHLLPGLIARFPAVPEERIRAAAEETLAEFDDVPVRSFVMTLVDRKARERLASEAPALRA